MGLVPISIAPGFERDFDGMLMLQAVGEDSRIRLNIFENGKCKRKCKSKKHQS